MNETDKILTNSVNSSQAVFMKEKKCVKMSRLDLFAMAAVFVLTYYIMNSLIDFAIALPFTLSYVAVFIFASVYIISKNGFKKEGVFSGIICVLISLSFALHGEESHFILAFLVLIFLSGAYCVELTDSAKHSSGSYFYLLDVLKCEVSIPLKNLFLPLCSLKTLKKTPDVKEKKEHKRFFGILLGFICAVPVLLIVIPLLIDSDAAFESMTASAVNKIKLIADALFKKVPSSYDFGDFLLTLIPTAIFAPYIYSVMFSFRHGLCKEENKNTAEKYAKLRSISPNIFTGFLGIISVVYLIYLFSQTAYFFSAFVGHLPDGSTISVTEYARRGFFEMTKIAAINFVLIALAVLFSKRKSGKLSRAVKCLCLFLCVFTIILISTSVSKILLYIAQMGLTHKRIYVFVFDIVLIVCFLAVIIRLLRQNFAYMKVIISFACCALTVLCLVGTDNVIAKYNTQMYLSGKLETVDVETVSSLGFSQIEQLDKLASVLDANISDKAKNDIGFLYHVYIEQMLDEKEKFTLDFSKIAFESADEYKAYLYSEDKIERFYSYYTDYFCADDSLFLITNTEEQISDLTVYSYGEKILGCDRDTKKAAENFELMRFSSLYGVTYNDEPISDDDDYYSYDYVVTFKGHDGETYLFETWSSFVVITQDESGSYTVLGYRNAVPSAKKAQELCSKMKSGEDYSILLMDVSVETL